MREVVLDTETTGLNPEAGHRVIEIGCLELLDHLPTGRVFHEYLNPEREVPEEVVRIHGITAEMLRSKPRFAEVADRLAEFVQGARLVIHNAAFDLRFINAELARIERGLLEAAEVVDTVELARRRFPGATASLDALCRRFGIDNSARDKHGALRDAELLAEVYLELIGGRQPGLDLVVGDTAAALASAAAPGKVRRPRPHAPSEDEIARHRAFLARLKNPIWLA
ncbi:MAG: DNA polymerase III subunit epsilon [Proteobacteria bacterium]|nr:DNA polymerase III subunit epsilon [Pseudomonadota bacterium]